MKNGVVKLQGEKVIPVGYKLTEMGIIPSDWKIEQLGNLCSLKSGLSITSKDIDDSSFYRCFGGNGLRGYTKKYTHDGNFALIGRQGALCGNIQYVSGPFFASEHALVAAPTKGVDPKWLSIYLETMNLNQYSESSAQPGLSAEKLRILKLITPNLNEQTAIANVLSDTDALITQLEQLIAKKQDIKTATMQQLLTGRTRLAQFAKKPNETLKGYKTSELGMIPEDWEAKPFGELFESSLHRRTMRKEEIVSFVGMQDVSENAQLIKQSLLSFSEVKGGFTYFEKGDVLVAKITPCFENGKGCHTESLLTDIGFGSTEFHVLRAKNSSHSKFIYYWTTNNNLRKILESEMVGSAGHRRVPLSAIKNYLIPCPQTKVEQSAIAAILSDIDAELATLQQKLAKVRDIKQGMMQQLLTGRIRLPLDHQP